MSDQAKLPANYIAARNALAQCVRVDECAKWAAKALALQSYARQMKDGQMEHDAQRIRDRAMQRAGELLGEIKKEKTGPKQLKSHEGQKLTRSQAASDAGLSPKQAKTAMEIARVEKKLADEMIEATPPASVRELAAAGRTARPKPEPKPFGDEWWKWTSAIEIVSIMPACGLKVLAERNLFEIADLLAQCDAAITNLDAWRRELSDVSKKSADDTAREAVVALP
jgi:hypothetical protein